MTLATHACADDGGSVDGGTGDGDSTGNGDGADDGTPPTTADDGDDGDGDGVGTTDGGDDGMATTDDGADESTDDGGDATTDDGGSDGTTGGGDDAGVCAQGCVEDMDCCPPGAIGCPSEDYPNNWTCEEGICRFGGCAENADCDNPNPLEPDQECHPVDGLGTCVDLCGDNGDCTGLLGGDAECIGKTDDGDSFCMVPPPEPCKENADCAGNDAGATCLDGACVCTGEKDCADGDVCDMP